MLNNGHKQTFIATYINNCYQMLTIIRIVYYKDFKCVLYENWGLGCYHFPCNTKKT